VIYFIYIIIALFDVNRLQLRCWESRSDPSGAYRFGDFTRVVLRAGREQREASGTSGAPGGAASSGGEADGTAANTSYRPGDFTRGLWSKLRK
jgi:hypothetical protein